MKQNNNELKLKAKELFNEGVSLKDIAENLDINYNTLKYWKTKNFSIGEKKNEEITKQEEMFCILVADTNDIYSSAIKSGYSEAYALNTIYQLMKKSKIKKKIDSLKKIKQISLEISKEDILTVHKEIVFSRDIKNCYDLQTGELKNNIKNIKKFKIKDTEFGKDISFELEDRTRSLEFLTKYMGIDPQTELNRKKIELEEQKTNALLKENGIGTGISDLTKEEQENLLKKYAGKSY